MGALEIRIIEADFQRSADTHLIPLPLAAMHYLARRCRAICLPQVCSPDALRGIALPDCAKAYPATRR
jgi:hypothetical protein